MNPKLRLYVPGPHWFIRPHNTDWLYTQMLCRLGEFHAGIETIPERSLAQAVETNLRYFVSALAARARIRIPEDLRYKLAQYRSLSKREVISAKPDVILAYERYPRHARAPVVWMTGPVPERWFQRKDMESTVRREIAWRRECATSAAQVACSTEYSRRAFCAQTGIGVERVHVLPFLLPHLAGGGRPKDRASASRNLRCLFVGREAIRKGLPRALQILRATSGWTLHVITDFSDGRVALPPNVTHQERASSQEVLEWMERSDVLFSLSDYDTFGFAAVEAASRQCMPVFRSGSIQETMFSPDAALFVRDDWTPETCVSAIAQKAIGHREPTREALLSEFRRNFAPENVAELFYSLASNAVGDKRGASTAPASESSRWNEAPRRALQVNRPEGARGGLAQSAHAVI